MLTMVIRHGHGTLCIVQGNVAVIRRRNTCPCRVLELSGNTLHIALQVKSFLSPVPCVSIGSAPAGGWRLI